MRKRAEQSARDKEHHRRLLAERAKKATIQNDANSAEYIPPTPVSTHNTAHKSNPKHKFRQDS